MASFQAKLGWKRPRKIKNKNYRKLNNTIMASFQDKIGWKTQKNRENKNCHSVPFRSYHTRN